MFYMSNMILIIVYASIKPESDTFDRFTIQNMTNVSSSNQIKMSITVV